MTWSLVSLRGADRWILLLLGGAGLYVSPCLQSICWANLTSCGFIFSSHLTRTSKFPKVPNNSFNLEHNFCIFCCQVGYLDLFSQSSYIIYCFHIQPNINPPTDQSKGISVWEEFLSVEPSERVKVIYRLFRLYRLMPFQEKCDNFMNVTYNFEEEIKVTQLTAPTFSNGRRSQI